MDKILELIQQYWPVVTAAIALCAAIATVTPSTADNKIVQFILDVINKIGLNVGRAKNLDDYR